ncbi:MAG: hypothetical protein BAJALOKI3v1_770023 [Promethearchaeota archaeon]|nr:MAG: hypothetical protein BAJALOKI3v1_770023 [Candidatus Lokiarchaeota archaeon]
MKVYLNLMDNLHFKARARHFTDIEIDEPESFHGTDKGPSSVEYLLIGIGGCLGSSFQYCLQKNHIPAQKLEVMVDGTLKHTGSGMHLSLVEINCEIMVSVEGEYDDLVDKCTQQFKKHCVINESINQGIPLNTTIFKKENEQIK